MAISQARIPLDEKSTQPKILSFAGGGVLGTAHIGALIALQEMELTDSIEIATGTSIGAFIALALALNYSGIVLANKLLNNIIDLKKIEDSVIPEFPKIDIHSLYTIPSYLAKLPLGIIKSVNQNGLCSGKQIEVIIKDLIRETLLSIPHDALLKKINDAINNEKLRQPLLNDQLSYDKNAKDKDIVTLLIQLKNAIEGKSALTLAGLHYLKLLCPEMKLKDLFVTATNVSSDPLALEMFSYKTKPNMPIEIAIHCSMAATPVYAPVVYEGTMYVDGGYLCNTPHQFFKSDETTRNKPILCVEFGKSGLYPTAKLPMSLPAFFNRLSFFPLTMASANRSKEDSKEVISLNNLKTCVFDFKLSTTDKMELITQGYKQTAEFLLAGNYVSANHLFMLDHHYFMSILNPQKLRKTP